MNIEILKHIEKLKFSRTKSALFSAAGGTRGFLKYGLVVLYKLSELCNKGLQYAVLVK